MADGRGAQARSDEITFVLTDIVSSTRLWELNPLAMDAAVARHDEIVRAIVTKHGGNLVRHRGEGDSTFSTFDDPASAIVAAADVIRALSDEPWPGNVVIRTRIGINTGRVFERSGDWYGPTVNRAARLRGLADEHQILVSAATAARAGDILPAGIALVDRGDRAMKGVDQPEAILEVYDERSTKAAGPDTTATVAVPLPPDVRRREQMPLAGRDGELGRLLERWDEVRTGRPRAALISGEPGQGKSRLARELARRAHADGAVVLYATADDQGAHFLGPVGVAVAQLVRALDPVVARTIVGESAAVISRLDPGVARHLGEPPANVGPADLGSVFDAVTDLLLSLSESSPLVAVIDDFHRAEPTAAEFIGHIAARTNEARLLLVLTYRDAEIEPGGPLANVLDALGRTGAAERVRLEGLDRTSIEDLLRSAGADPDRLRRAADVLFSATRGNPLFVTELLREDRTRTILDAQDPEDLVLPESVREVVAARVERLPQAAVRALRVAAVLGSEIDQNVVAEVLGTSMSGLLDLEDSWLDAGLVRESPGGGLVFAHAVLRQALVDDVADPRRRRLHRQAAEALDAIDDTDPVRVARHWIAAGDEAEPERVAKAACDGAHEAVRRLAYEEAERLIAAGVSAAERCNGVRAAATLAVLRAEIALQRGRIEDALVLASTAAELARDAGDAVALARAALARFNGYTVVLAGEDEEGMALHEHALHTLKEAPALRARLLANLSNHLARRGGQGTSALPLAEEAVQIATSSQDVAALAHALRHWVQVDQGSADVTERVERCDQLVAAAERTGDRWEIAQALQRRAATRLELGDREGYEADVADAERRAARVDTDVARYEIRFRRVLRALLDGRFADAEGQLDGLAELMATFPTAADAWSAQTMMLYRETGSLEPLLPVIEDSLARNPSLAGFRAAHITALADTGRFDDARQALRTFARDDFADAPRDSSWPTVAALCGEAAIRANDVETAAMLRQLVVPYSGLVLLAYESICVGSADRFIGMLDAFLGAPDDGRMVAAVDLETRIAAPPLVARTRLWQARVRWQAGDRDGAAAVLDEAIQLSSSLGMRGVLAEARTELDGMHS